MSQLQDTHVTVSGQRSSKRKRAQVNYYEDVSDFEDLMEEDNSQEVVGEYSQPKKRKASRPVRPLPKRKIFPFLELPAEIRIMIYEYCLTDPQNIHLLSVTENYRRTVERADVTYMKRRLNHWTNSNMSNNEELDEVVEPRKLVPSILAVNKQIYKEGREMLYGNAFVFSDPLALHSFMANIGPRAAALLKDITIGSWQYSRGMHKAYNHACFAVLAFATNIQKLKLDCWLGTGSQPKWVARQIYRDGFPWLEAVAAAKGKLDAAVDVIEVRNDNFSGRGWRSRSQVNPEQDVEDFKNELRRLLGAQMKRIKAAPKKATKKTKAN
ncbi:uncharacterized protein BDR25DRAFT_289805 [Lindgomyces ingoldianus]|uniref:Uncharacterized protein n=1 Tax=Lindgomyces ingoldianus TaxID=673940 RepID=A0ACB6QPA4_9PLEO|nr:uncharacterized protein BDR25DRAFT_289805 [Lindgomyces ingoldianus]KAF2468859.1 hypothetical protein BDR25DRAFT_289805 [Lindgomyces ingoldianus]